MPMWKYIVFTYYRFVRAYRIMPQNLVHKAVDCNVWSFNKACLLSTVVVESWLRPASISDKISPSLKFNYLMPSAVYLARVSCMRTTIGKSLVNYRIDVRVDCTDEWFCEYNNLIVRSNSILYFDKFSTELNITPLPLISLFFLHTNQ